MQNKDIVLDFMQNKDTALDLVKNQDTASERFHNTSEEIKLQAVLLYCK